MSQPNSPLPPATFFILFALASGDKHGYAIMKETRKLSDEQFQMGPATLYTTIQRLLESGWIEEVKGAEDEGRRRYYHLTAEGQSAFHLELGRMEAVVRKSKLMRLRPMESAS